MIDQSSGLLAAWAATSVPFGDSVEQYLGNLREIISTVRVPPASPPVASLPALVVGDLGPEAIVPTGGRLSVSEPTMSQAARVSAIDAATLPGCEALAAVLKADPTVTAGAAALRILDHYKLLHGHHVAASSTAPNAVRDASAGSATADAWRVERQASAEFRGEFPTAGAYASNMPSDPAGDARRSVAAELAGPGSVATGPAGSLTQDQVEASARQEWRASVGLQHEFRSVETYVAFRKAEARGAVKIHAPGANAVRAPAGTINKATSMDAWRGDWHRSAELQRDFPTADAYANYRVGVAEGRVKVHVA